MKKLEKIKYTVAHINSSNDGSIGSIINSIKNESKYHSILNYVCIPKRRSYKYKKEDEVFTGSIIGRAFHLIIFKFTGLYGLFSIIDTLMFLKKIDKIKPDIIHLHNLHNCYINLPLLFSYIKRNDINVVWTLHDCWAFTGQCTHFEDVGCDKWQYGCEKCPQYKKYPSSYIDNTKLMYKLKKKWFAKVRNLVIITPSQWLNNLVSKSFLNEYPVYTVHSGIDLKIFKPTHSDFKSIWKIENKIMILGVAYSWSYRKGLDVFIELSKRLDDRYIIVLVGLSEKQIIELESSDKIIMIGKTETKEQLSKIYSAADIFVNPTREEVLGLVNIEALACGTPVITFNSGGSSECISSGTGFSVQKNNIDGIVDKIDELGHKKINTIACINRALLFDEEICYKKYIEIYNRMVHENLSK